MEKHWVIYSSWRRYMLVLEPIVLCAPAPQASACCNLNAMYQIPDALVPCNCTLMANSWIELFKCHAA